MLEASQLARSTFYWQSSHSERRDKHALIKTKIADIFTQSQERYGSRKIVSALSKQAVNMTAKTVLKLMREIGIRCKIKGKRYPSYVKGKGRHTAQNLMARDFSAAHPNEKWVTDVTEFKVAKQKLFFSPVMDLFNREIITWTVNTSPTYSLVQTMLRQALTQLPEGKKVILHSDQGWHYRMDDYVQQLKERGVIQSMSRKGNCYDNAVIESFFGTLKNEFFRREKFNSVEELVAGLKKYVDWYNHVRIKPALKGLSPVEYRTQYQKLTKNSV
ncbi:IS3 family transposase [Hafnia paralvei]|uniref:IS3 family transposase n=1 Tax=Hafnia paralvei TaxID=546367 RepID=UPI00300CADF3